MFGGYYRMPFFTGLVAAVFGLCMINVGVFVASFVINALAPTFGAEKSSIQSLKLVVYAATPAWIAGALRIIPVLGILRALRRPCTASMSSISGCRS